MLHSPVRSPSATDTDLRNRECTLLYQCEGNLKRLVYYSEMMKLPCRV